MARQGNMAEESCHRNPDKVVVVMVPFPAQGHLNQLLHLSRLILSYNIPVHYVGTATHNRQATMRFSGWDPKSTANMYFHDFNIPPFPSPSPEPNAMNNFPRHLQPAFDASLHLREPLAQLLQSLSSVSERVVVINDSLMAYVVQDVAVMEKAESYTFHSVSAFTVAWFLWETMGIPVDRFINIPKDLPSLEGCFSNEFLAFLARQYEFQKISSGNLYNTNRIIEEPYMKIMERIKGNKNQWAIGPFNPVAIEKESSRIRHYCLQWLDKQQKHSVIYVCFGTTTTLADEQIKELAVGLEKSKQKFIWVLRDADKGDVFSGKVRKAELPIGFEEKVQDKGLILREWAPQLEILNHTSTGGFMSHCGWNSCMESITMGVPVATWPMHSDQPRNAVLMTKLLNVGIVVKDWGGGNELLVSASVIANAVRKLMASSEGDRIRKRAMDMGTAVRKSMDNGEVSRLELESFIDHITR
uniref:Glycosyltransferase n=1 Tax=Polygala tenuifolia TaxID=355332 RepID=A0A3G3NC65_9FABA|nr:UDP-glucosyltransferase UGT93A11 [Polygala tenuifolia]